MDRVRIILNDMKNYHEEGRLNAAYYKSLEAYFEILQVIVAAYFFAPPFYVSIMRERKYKYSPRDTRNIRHKSTISPEISRKLFQIAEGTLKQAERLLSAVIEIDPKLAEALEAEVLLVTGKKAIIQPKILSPSLMFRNINEEALKSVQLDNDDEQFVEKFSEKDKLFPQIPLSRLALDFCGVHYNALLVLQRGQLLRQESPKNKSNALYLADLRTLFSDLVRLQIQRDGLDHVIFQSQQELSLFSISPKSIAEQLSLIDSGNFSRLRVVNELEYSGWLGKERRLRSPNLTDMREFGGFVSHWVTDEVLKAGLTFQQRAEVIVYFISVAELLADLASYHMVMSVIRGLSTHAILRLGPLLRLLPKKTIISWDTLQGFVSDSTRQRALLSKAPATCIPAIDTAYLSELLFFEPQLLTLKGSDPADGSSVAKHKFKKYCEAIEKFRLQSSRVYGIKYANHPALQHFVLTRPFLSSNELMAASHLILSSDDQQNVLRPEYYPVKEFYRRYLDDDDRLFLPLIYSAREDEDLPVLEVEADFVPEDDHFSLGDQDENSLKNSTFIPMDDVDERAGRVNYFNSAINYNSRDSYKVPIDQI